MEESKERSLRLSLGSLGVEGGWVRGRWSDIRRGQGFVEPTRCRDLPLAGAARAVRIRRFAIGLEQSASVWVVGRTKDAQEWVLAFCAIFLKARESGAGVIDS